MRTVCLVYYGASVVAVLKNETAAKRFIAFERQDKKVTDLWSYEAWLVE